MTEGPVQPGDPDETIRADRPAPSTPASPERDPFAPGTVLADRYRVIQRLGEGGMGTVYRADDLTLGVSVALKFLPQDQARDERWLDRFRNEVRVAREVSHPNICRTYDLGTVEINGAPVPFISMEYVDGEDLASLLRRIGRLPMQKAIDITRQVCAGLAAAHDRGVLHRDLKPANIMLDGRGRVRITDFGIAGLAEEIGADDARSGTPAYMAPEQLDGSGVSRRSELYSLGLVMYELFTGNEAWSGRTVNEVQRLRTDTDLSRPSTIVQDIDPLVEAVIMRCLEPDPNDRPESAIAVAASLPGGDPLAMAMAAGETPSPEMVARAGATGALSGVMALSLLIVTVLTIIGAALLTSRLLYLNHAETKSPVVLVDRAQEILEEFGFDPHGGDNAWVIGAGWHSEQVLNWLKDQDEERTDREAAAMAAPSPLRLRYRTSPTFFQPKAGLAVDSGDPPVNEPGMISLQVDGLGRLTHFKRVPEWYDHVADDTDVTDEQWQTVLGATGLDMETLQPAQANWVPSTAYDHLRAWTGTYPGHSEQPMHVEIAFKDGALVSVTTAGPWTSPTPPVEVDETSVEIDGIINAVILVLLLLANMGLAVHNLRRNRGDRQGALRLAGFVFVSLTLTWLTIAHHVPGKGELAVIRQGLEMSVFLSAVSWCLYISVEPYLRRLWPQMLISWTRLLSGRWRDPGVGRDTLIGICGGCTLVVLAGLQPLVIEQMGGHANRSSIPQFFGLGANGGRLVSLLGESMISGLLTGTSMLFLLVVLRFIVRKPVAAVVLFAMLASLVGSWDQSAPVDIKIATAITSVLTSVTLTFILVRHGLLATVTALIVKDMFDRFPITVAFDQWYSSYSTITLIGLAAVAALAFHIARTGVPIRLPSTDR